MTTELACLDSFFTFKTLCPGTDYVRPKSGLHIEDLPGISIGSLAAVEPGKYLNAHEFFNEKTRFAGQQLIDEMRAHLETYNIEGGPKESGTIGTFNDTTAVAGTMLKLGVRIRVDSGPMGVPLVSRVWLRCKDDVSDMVVHVSDGITSAEYSIDVLGGGVDNELWLHFEAREKTVDVWVEDERFIPYLGSTEGTKYFSTCSTCGGHARYKYIAGGGMENDVELEEMRGIRAEVTLLCSLTPVACILLRRFRQALLFKTGALVLHEWIGSPRTNYFTIHSKEWAAATMEKWEKEDVPRHMKTHIKTLAHFVRNLDPACLECGVGPSYGNAHP